MSIAVANESEEDEFDQDNLKNRRKSNAKNLKKNIVKAPEINERERKQSTVKPPDPKDLKRKESRTSTIKSTDKEKESDKGSKSEKGCNSFGAHIFERKEVFVWYLMAPLLLKGW